MNSFSKKHFDSRSILSHLQKIFEKTINRLFVYKFDSIWHKSGKGWQEAWDEKTNYAGVYASCDGIILLNLLGERFKDKIEINKTIDAAYKYHLIRIFNTKIKCECKDHENNRSDTIYTTMKIAKFIQAANNVPIMGPKEKEISRKYHKLLKREFVNKNGLLNHTFSSETNDFFLPALIESIVALYPLKESGIFYKLKDLLLTNLKKSFKENHYGEFCLILWGISYLLEYLSNKEKIEVKELAIKSIKIRHVHNFEHYRRNFFNPHTKRTDYYSYNHTLIYLKAILKLINEKIIKPQFFYEVLDSIVKILETYSNYEYFINKKDGQLLFWENFQAIITLIELEKYLNNYTNYFAGEFMYINPKFFKTKKFEVNENLIVVLMPLGPKWSNDVYKAFEEAAEENKMQIWRSDKEHVDDEIMQTIWERINEAKLIICDCTYKNPNVLYELGIAHTIGKPVFICAQKREDINFDINNIRNFIYGILGSELKEMKEKLTKFIKTIKRSKNG